MDTWNRRILTVLAELGILALATFLLQLHWVLVASFAALIVIAGLAPHRWSGLLTGLGMLGVAAVAHFYYGQDRIAILLAIIGLVFLALGIPRLLNPASSR